MTPDPNQTQVDELRAKIEELLPLFYERKGFRELCWCPNLNEPVILTYRHEKGKPTLTVCENCGTTDRAYIMESHPFIGSVKKTHEPRDGLVDELINTFTALLVKERG